MPHTNKDQGGVEAELKYCSTCMQMTNHDDATCLKCGLAERGVEETLKRQYVPWMESFGTKETFDRVITAIDNLHQRVSELEQTLHQELQKAREQRKGWKGYLVVDPETDNYTYSDVYLNRIDAEKWLKANGISGLKIIEVDVYQSELDQPIAKLDK